MKRREFIKTGAAAALGSLVATSLRGGFAQKRPNIVMIVADDLGWKDLGCMGSAYYETPNIDQIAKEGMMFTDAYACAPNCAPSRACLMTGQYGPRHGIYTVNSPARGHSRDRKIIPIPNKTILAPENLTFSDILKREGYVSASIGKWHLGEDPLTGPKSQGFDVNIGGKHIGHPPEGYFPPYGLPRLEKAEEGEYLTDRLTEEAVQFMEANRDQPFFLYLPHYAVHTPLEAKKDLVRRYEDKDDPQGDAVYGAMTHSLDQGVGRILDYLKKSGLEENTMVVFFSDNGGVKGITDMTPLRGGKGMLYEGGIRVPLLIKWPGMIKPGAISREPVSGIDFFPTFLDMLNLERPQNHPLDGKSLLPLLTQSGPLERESLFWHFPAYLEAYYRSNEGARDPLFRTRPVGVVRKGDWKLLEFFENGDLELYHLKEDIGEKNNLASVRKDKVKELRKEMKAWRRKTHAPVPSQPNPEYAPSEKMKKNPGG